MSARLLIALALAVLCGCGSGASGAAPPPASTLRATLVDPDGDGALERGPGEPLVDRADVGGGGKPGTVLATLAQLTDTHVRDEESPARAPFLDRAGGAFRSTFRPQEALSPQVLAAAVRAVDRLGPDATVVTGDILDSAEAVELDQAVGVLDGGTVDPGTGGPGYAGIQDADNPDPLIYRPDVDAPRHPGLLAAAQRPFRSPGLTAPWYPALGNHDVLVAGETPPTARLDALATGGRMVVGLDPELLRAEIERTDTARAVDSLLAGGALPRSCLGPRPRHRCARGSSPASPAASLERAIRVPADPRRRHLRPAELIERLTTRRRAPAALRAAAGRRTLDYEFDVGRGVRAIVLDTADRHGGARGRLSAPQLAWLAGALRRAAGRPVLVFAHNALETTVGGGAALAALDATPGVIAVITGNSHRNQIRPRRRPAAGGAGAGAAGRGRARGGYWLISTSSLADHPQQARALRLRRTAQGYALETWMLDHDGRGLAGAARELAFLDAQGGRPQGFAGRREDRNARLYVAG